MSADADRIVVIDQHTQVVKTEQKRGWFPRNSRPRLPVSGVRQSINLLGALTDAGEQFISLIPGRLTAEVAMHFLRALQHEFGDDLVIVLDNAGYFVAKSLKRQATAAGLRLEYLPPYAPELNPLEECWKQLRASRANRLFTSLDELIAHLRDALPSLSAPSIYEYLC